MKTTKLAGSVPAAIFLIISLLASTGQAGDLPAPPILAAAGINSLQAPLDVANCFLRIPYRVDGVLDHQGRFTLFEHQDRIFETPGLNCSGLVLSASRYLLNRNITIDQARADRLGDSGPGAPFGKNWDFGWDLIMNLTDGFQRRIIVPGPDSPLIEGADAAALRGFNLQDSEAWEKVLPQIRPGLIYLAGFSRPARNNGLQHYHVGLILADEKGGVWLYQTTRTRGPYRVNLASARGLANFKNAFKQWGERVKMILIIETRPNS